jgi:predicted nucleic acid-binding protein
VIAVDTSSLIAYLSGERGADVDATALAFEHRQAALPPIVLTEVVSDPTLSSEVKTLLASLPMLEVLGGYWERASLLRARMTAQGRRARLADTLITQSCLDHDVELVTRDRDFIAFAHATGLRLLAARPGRSRRAAR